MPKRGYEEKIQRYKDKLKRLEEKSNGAKRKRRYAIVESDASSVEKSDNEIEDSTLERLLPVEIGSEIIQPSTEPTNVTDVSSHQPEVPELAPEVLEALGDSTDETPKYGEEIHQNLSDRWQPILRKGLTKEVKEKLLTEYLPPSNCKLLKAPTLNPEIAAAITEQLRNRDKKLQIHQDQLGSGISAINKVMTLLLTKDPDKVTTLKLLSDATRILTDIHFIGTQSRIQLLTPSLDKSFLNLIEKGERDESLFGSNLPEKIKSARTIEKQGLSIKKNISTPAKPAASMVSSRPRQGNWSGPPRFQTNRGGRNAPRTTVAAAPRRAYTAPPPPMPSHTRGPIYPNKQRAPQRR